MNVVLALSFAVVVPCVSVVINHYSWLQWISTLMENVKIIVCAQLCSLNKYRRLFIVMARTLRVWTLESVAWFFRIQVLLFNTNDHRQMTYPLCWVSSCTNWEEEWYLPHRVAWGQAAEAWGRFNPLTVRAGRRHGRWGLQWRTPGKRLASVLGPVLPSDLSDVRRDSSPRGTSYFLAFVVWRKWYNLIDPKRS